MNPIVIDASVTVSWVLDDEFDPLAYAAMHCVEDGGGIVPQLWHYEVHNSLLIAERRGRSSINATQDGLDRIRGLRIISDLETDFQATLDLARAHRLSFYDALYLELALRRNLLLATLDRALARAAAASGLLLTTT